jgi:hypothetical protein
MKKRYHVNVVVQNRRFSLWALLDLVVSGDATRVVVAFAAAPGTVAARRFDCVAPLY